MPIFDLKDSHGVVFSKRRSVITAKGEFPQLRRDYQFKQVPSLPTRVLASHIVFLEVLRLFASILVL